MELYYFKLIGDNEQSFMEFCSLFSCKQYSEFSNHDLFNDFISNVIKCRKKEVNNVSTCLSKIENFKSLLNDCSINNGNHH